MTLADALETALDQAKLPEQSGAAVELARKYATLLDNAAPAEKYREALEWLPWIFDYYLENKTLIPTDRNAVKKARRTITAALAEHSVASDLGPKLLQVLTALNMTLPATAKPTEGESVQQPSSPHQQARAEARRLRSINGGAAG